jgi:hypothetical protein
VAIEWLAASRAAADPAHRGGDFFDVSRSADDAQDDLDAVPRHAEKAIRVVLGDVMGHGVVESDLAQRLAATWHDLVDLGVSDEELLPALDDAISAAAPIAESGVQIFATACALTLVPTPEGGFDITARLAGHPAPLIRDAAGARYLEAPPGPPLGLRTPGLTAAWSAASAEIESGDVLVLYTDGLLDSYAEQGSDGIAELAKAVEAIDRGIDARDWATTIISGAHRAASDDSLVLVFTTG